MDEQSTTSPVGAFLAELARRGIVIAEDELARARAKVAVAPVAWLPDSPELAAFREASRQAAAAWLAGDGTPVPGKPVRPDLAQGSGCMTETNRARLERLVSESQLCYSR